MTRIEIIVVSPIMIGGKMPQVIMTALPDMKHNELVYLFRKLADGIEEEAINVVNVDE